MAIDNGHLSVATMLIKRGADVNGADETGTYITLYYTPYHTPCHTPYHTPYRTP